MKFKIHDEDGSTFEIEEIKDETEEIVNEDFTDEDPVEPAPEATLTAEEISALKGLAAVAADLMALIAKPTDEEPTVEDEDVLEEETTEEVIDTASCDDSKKSFGSIEKKVVKDAVPSISVEDAFRKRYGGGNE